MTCDKTGLYEKQSTEMPNTIKKSILEKLPNSPVITSGSLHNALTGCISASAVAALREGCDGLVISEDNRMTLLRMLEDPNVGNGTVQRAELISLIDTLGSFLEKYMADQPEGHLWIVLCCVYLSMIVREPMHPQRFTHWYLDGDIYRCPAKEVSPDSVCLWCVCQAVSKETKKGRVSLLKEASDAVIRKRIVFYGQVQGVGFRYRARHAADLYGCTGWVKNEYDGSVTMEIQGLEEQIDQVILAIERGTYVRIENMDVRSLPTDPDERGFRTDW